MQEELDALLQTVFRRCGKDCAVDLDVEQEAIKRFLTRVACREIEAARKEVETLRQKLGHAEAAFKRASEDATNRRLALEDITRRAEAAARSGRA